jgi:hypothetical protein
MGQVSQLHCLLMLQVNNVFLFRLTVDIVVDATRHVWTSKAKKCHHSKECQTKSRMSNACEKLGHVIVPVVAPSPGSIVKHGRAFDESDDGLHSWKTC